MPLNWAATLLGSNHSTVYANISYLSSDSKRRGKRIYIYAISFDSMFNKPNPNVHNLLSGKTDLSSDEQ